MTINIKSAFDLLAQDASAIAESKGWKKGNDGEAIALMHSELSEALEAIRHGNPQSEHIKGFSSVEEELADEVIRIANFAGPRGLDIGGAIIAKMEYNATRPYKHGGKKF